MGERRKKRNMLHGRENGCGHCPLITYIKQDFNGRERKKTFSPPVLRNPSILFVTAHKATAISLHTIHKYHCVY